MPRSLKPPASLAISAGIHLVMLAVAAALTRTPPEDPKKGADPSVEAPRVEMIYVPPVEPPPPAVQPPPVPKPPAPVRPPPQPAPPRAPRTEPEPEPNAPPEAARSEGAETVEQLKADAAPAPKEQTIATLESEARRIFGRPRLMTRVGAGPQARRPMEAWIRENPERCVREPAAPGDSAGQPEFGTVTGRIFRQDNGRPLAGAHLQMIGTPYVAFTDGAGEYRFRFDLALMDNCRTQYVKVTAAGYESRLLVLVVGPNRSEDVRLRRR